MDKRNYQVSVIIVNYKQSSYVPACIQALMEQTYPNIEVIFIDNDSRDGSVEFVKSKYSKIKVIQNSTNLFYSKAHNIGIRESNGSYLLSLNVDVVISPKFIEEMVKAIEINPRVGMVSGKLLKTDKNMIPIIPPAFDSTGLWFSRQLRHFDRGYSEQDNGQYEDFQYIFGPSGAAPLYRREMLEDISIEGEFFDEDFVIYREDADLAWRAQLLGWKGVYTSKAVAYHLRRVRPSDNRKHIDPVLNMHSVKNRFLMRIKNFSWKSGYRCIFPILWRDILVIGYVVLVEHRSLQAFFEIIRLFPRMIRKRRAIMRKKRVDDSYMSQWFSSKPVSYRIS